DAGIHQHAQQQERQGAQQQAKHLRQIEVPHVRCPPFVVANRRRYAVTCGIRTSGLLGQLRSLLHVPASSSVGGSAGGSDSMRIVAGLLVARSFSANALAMRWLSSLRTRLRCASSATKTRSSKSKLPLEIWVNQQPGAGCASTSGCACASSSSSTRTLAGSASWARPKRNTRRG